VATAIVASPRWHLVSSARVLAIRPLSRQTAVTPIAHPRTVADRIVNGAKAEVIRGVQYDSGYVSIRYPNGDVPADRGACTEVIIRGLRNAGYDLQQLMHEDMKRDFSAYPKLWGLSAPDSNIDHRRVPNHLVFMRRHGLELPRSTAGRDAATWQPGDLVYWRLPSGQTHCGVISNDRSEGGLPLVIHNIGPVASQQDCLTAWEIIGHSRYPPVASPLSSAPRPLRQDLRVLPHNGGVRCPRPTGDRGKLLSAGLRDQLNESLHDLAQLVVGDGAYPVPQPLRREGAYLGHLYP
jgi:uncharacterized protein YijF (DUF1287 family)